MDIASADAPRLTWPLATVAHALGLSVDTFSKKRRQLEELHGFPRKLPGINSWSIPAVKHWVATNGGTYLQSQPAIPNDDPEIGAIVSELELEYGGAAR